MASPQIWLEVLASIKALFDATTSSVDVYDAYRKHRDEKDTQQEAARASTAYSTFSEQEVTAMLERLNGCRDRFIAQGGGKERAACLCSVLKEAKDANGGTLPNIDDWKRIFATLGC
ncbi:MAG: hypothetical protein ABSH00_06815 [Bryobacteraceae bacterium]|jgi:hypothetical protein